MGWESFDVVRIDLGPLLQGHTWITKLKSVYNLLIIGPRGLQCETTLQEIMGWESSDVVRRQDKDSQTKRVHNSFIIDPRGL